jgi:hypothetical protein
MRTPEGNILDNGRSDIHQLSACHILLYQQNRQAFCAQTIDDIPPRDAE